MSGDDPYEYARRLATDAVAVNDPTGWFERLYSEAEAGDAVVPWGGSPNRMLVEWVNRKGLRGKELQGKGRRAVVVGCGLGDDAEHIARHGFDTVGFDVAASAVHAARRRFPGTRVDYVRADILGLPDHWSRAFDLVVEIFTVQVLPAAVRADAIAAISGLVAPGGTLLVIARAGRERDTIPWPLTRADIDAFAADGCAPVRIENLGDTPEGSVRRWRAEFTRLSG